MDRNASLFAETTLTTHLDKVRHPSDTLRNAQFERNSIPTLQLLTPVQIDHMDRIVSFAFRACTRQLAGHIHTIDRMSVALHEDELLRSNTLVNLVEILQLVLRSVQFSESDPKYLFPQRV